MATQSGSIRRGLPRVPGGEPWPPAGEAPAHLVTASAAPAAVQEMAPEAAQSVPVEAVNDGGAAASAPVAAVSGRLRRGLPRVPGGEPWPPAGEVLASAADRSAAPADVTEPAKAAPAAAAVAPIEKAAPAA